MILGMILSLEMRSVNVLDEVFMLKPTELRLVTYSFCYFFSLLAGYFLLRPIRDEMGMLNGASNMQWLFTGTFLAMLLLVPIFGSVTRKFTLTKVLIGSNLVFSLSILVFYFTIKVNGISQFLAVTFFIWLSLFNLFIISLFWSLMADIFSSPEAKRVFGIIAGGGSLGAIVGPLIASFIATRFEIEGMLLTAFLLLSVAVLFLCRIIFTATFDPLKSSKKQSGVAFRITAGTWKSIRKIYDSSYLMGIILLVFLYTFLSTFLYFEQAHVIEKGITQSAERIQYFSSVDLATNTVAICSQLFLTNRIIRSIGLAVSLAIIPAIIALGFLAISVSMSLPVIGCIMVLHRAGNYSILKPGREILFTVVKHRDKYRAKNFIDTAVYRGGDALTGWLFAALLSLGVGLSAIAILGIPIAIIWACTGFKLGKSHESMA